MTNWTGLDGKNYVVEFKRQPRLSRPFTNWPDNCKLVSIYEGVDFTEGYTLPDEFTYSRGTVAMMELNDGTWRTYGTAEPLMVPGEGLFCPGAYTNYSLSTDFQGFVAGTIGSGGVLASGWLMGGGSTIVCASTGTENGRKFADMTITSASISSGCLFSAHHCGGLSYAANNGDKFTEISAVKITGVHPTHPTNDGTRIRKAIIIGAATYEGESDYIVSIPFESTPVSTVTLVSANVSGNAAIYGTGGYYGNYVGSSIAATFRMYSSNLVNLPFAPADGRMLIPNSSSSAASTSNAAVCSKDLGVTIPCSFMIEFKTPNEITTNGRVLSIGADASNRTIDLYYGATTLNGFANSGGVAQVAAFSAGNVAVNTVYRVACRLENNNFGISFNGGSVVTDVSCDFPAPTKAWLGQYFEGVSQSYTFIRKLVGPVEGAWSDEKLMEMSTL